MQRHTCNRWLLTSLDLLSTHLLVRVVDSHSARKCFVIVFLIKGSYTSFSPFSCRNNAASQCCSLFQVFHVNVVCVVKSLPVKGEPDLWHGP